jgi:oxygen-independent coproporphyrinogen-3 oxidase
MNRVPHIVTPVSAQAAIEESFFLGLRLNCGVDLERLHTEFSAEFSPATLLNVNCHPERSEGPVVCQQSAKTSPSRPTFSQEAIATWESAIKQCVQDGLLEQQRTTLRLTARGRLLSNEVFARFLTEEREETKVGTGHVNPR